MPVFKVATQKLTPDNKPDWCSLTKIGIFSIPTDGGEFDRHFHDCNEYWLIFAGRALVESEGIQYEIGPGDVVGTQAGQEHDIIAIYEDLHGFFVEEHLVGEQRVGHLHRTPEDAKKHPVPFRSRPGASGA